MVFRKGLLISCVAVGAAIVSTASTAATCPDEGFAAVADAKSVLFEKRVIAAKPDLSDDWKEDHCSASRVFKVGDGTAVDPYKETANWVALLGFVQYNYGDPGSPYTWRVFTKAADTEVCFQTVDPLDPFNAAKGEILATGTIGPGACP